MLKAADLESRLRTAHGRYAETGSALHGYATALSEAQASAGPALRSYDAEVERRDAAASLEVRFEQMAMIATDDESTEWYRQQARAQASRRDDAAVMVARHGASVDAAHESVEAAARTAIARIDTATDDGLRDTVWDDVSVAVGDGYDAFQAWMEENDAWISTVLDFVSTVSWILAAAAFWVPGLNVVLLGVAVAVLALATARLAAGTGTWTELGFAALSLASFGTGALLVRSVTAATKGVAAGRVAALIDEGCSTSFATSWVATSWSRAAPGLGDRFLARAFGDPAIGRLLHFLRPSRPGAFADDPVVVASILRRVDAARRMAIGDTLIGVGRAASARFDDILLGREEALR
ncbi:hypothetical protein [Frigoribacterium sp. PhB160]|uniref:hypothetical protein n=1 Tax=Frigoribacterium sp. PhB160 TaxID=2485192 RepID=UPI0011CD8C59|nr:hypothetical protein [Frigoribacterium sp. PhB160]